MQRAILQMFFLVAFYLLSFPGFSSGITLGAGATLNLGDGQLSLNCTDFNIVSGASVFLQQGILSGVRDIHNSGLLDADAGRVSLGGDWQQSGELAAGSSSVAISEDCGRSTTTLGGSSRFYDFSVNVPVARSLVFPTGERQYVAHELTLRGSASGLLILRSASPGQFGVLDLAAGGIQDIRFVDVADNLAPGQPLAPGPPANFDSVDSGNTPGWFGQDASFIFSDQFE